MPYLIGTGNEKQIKQNITNRNASPGRNGGIFSVTPGSKVSVTGTANISSIE